ncbi:MAG: metallophosphoesterase [Phycisphaeraceae bacterium]
MRFVLIGDMHVYRLYVQPWELLSKRVMGQVNLWTNRRFRFRMSLLGELIERAKTFNPDMLLSSGDFTTTSLLSEFAKAKKVLQPLLDERPAFVVPGNHDRYTTFAMRRRAFERFFHDHTAKHWPHHQKLSDKLHLIGLDIAKPTWLFAGTTISDRQLAGLRQKLAAIEPDARVIIVCHYPIGTPADRLPERPSHALHNAEALTAVLAESPQQMLYLHGHVHEPWCYQVEAAPNVVAVNAGAPVMTGLTWPMGQGLWEIEVNETGWHLAHHARDAEGAWRRAAVATPDEPGQVAVVEPPPTD